MEIAGLVTGLVGLYGACLEIVNRVESYKNFDIEAQQLWAEFKATKVILEKWAERVGLSNEGLSDTHDRQLDDPNVAEAVSEVLTCLRGVLETTDPARYGIRRTGSSKLSSMQMSIRAPVSSPNPMSNPSRKRDKITWTFGNKQKFAMQVEVFGKLVGKLDGLVPRNGSSKNTNPVQQLDNTGLREGVDQTIILRLDELRRTKDEEKRDLLAWLNPVHYDERYESCRACRIKGTCSWIFAKESFIEWRSNSFPKDTAKFLWIYGPAGYGKSTLCANIVESLKLDKTPHPVYYFYRSGSKGSEDSRIILRAWIAQMVIQDNILLTLAQEQLLQSNYQASRPFLWSLFTVLVHNAPLWTFVLDGLDEHEALGPGGERATEESRLSFLVELQKAVADTRTRVLIVSRDETDIRSQMSSGKPQSVNLTIYNHEIRKDDVESDILVFSRSVVDERLANKSDTTKDEIAESIAKKCDGMFLWIDLQQRKLRGGKNKRQLQQTIEEMPNGLESVYERSWKDILNLPAKDKSRALDILRWATFAVRPLTVAEITEALLVPEDDRCEDLPLEDLPDGIDEEYVTDEIRALCGSLLELHSAGPGQSLDLMTVHLKHFSVKEFLLATDAYAQLSDERDKTPSYSGFHNNHLAIVCLRYLKFSNVKEDMETQRGERSFVDYAVRSWHQHVSKTGDRYQDLSRHLDEFFAPGNVSWNLWRVRFDQLWAKEHPEEEYGESEIASRAYYAAWFGLEDIINYLHSNDSDAINQVGGAFGTAISAACVAGHLALVMRLAELGAELNVSAGRLGSILGAASSYGDAQVCRYLLNRHVNASLTDRKGRSPLYAASSNGHVEVVRLLLDYGADVSIASNDGWTPLNAASSNGHVEVVKLLLDRGADISVANNYGWTPLNAASLNGHVEVVKLLLDRGANTSVANNNGWTPLNTASSNGHVEVVKLLLDRGADISVASNDRWTPLNAASSNGHVEVIKLLLDRGADISVANNDGWTPLNAASSRGHVEVVKLLLDRGADVSVANNDGWTPLNIASSRGHVEVVRLLLDRGADTSVANNNGWTPLNTASSRGHVEVVKLLLDRGADVSVANNDGRTPLNAASSRGHVEVVKLLLDYSADLSVADNDGWTPLYAASLGGHVEVVKLLLDYSADLSVADNDGWTSLNTASLNGHVEVVKLLLDRGADVSVTSNDGWTPLNAASSNGHVEVVKLLLDRGADISVANNYGWTPLNTASLNGHVEVVKLLLDRGANTSVANNDGWTPLNIASSNGHVEVVRPLLDRGVDISVANNNEWTPLNTASFNGHVEVVKLLLDRGADISVSNNDGRTPLNAASSRGHVEVVKLLLDYSADLSVADNDGWTPLYAASLNGHVEVVKLLLDRGANISAANNNGWTPLHSASDKGHIETVKLLLRNTSNSDALTRLSETCLHLACRHDVPEIITLLISHGCDPLLIDDYGRSCLDWAALHRPCLTATKDWASKYTPTAKTDTAQILKSTLARLVHEALTKASDYYLGRFLLFAGDTPNCLIAFGWGTINTNNGILHSACCDFCSPQKSIVGNRFVCKSCPNVDLCQQCFGTFRHDERSWRCQNHEFFEVSYSESELSGEASARQKQRQNWLRELQKQYS